MHEKMSFGQALEALKAGMPVSRAGYARLAKML